MFKITLQDAPEALTLVVEGRLVGPWAKELEHSWRTISSIKGQKSLLVDLKEVLFIDEEGKRVLTKLFQEGASFRSSGPMTDSIVAEITGKSAGSWRNIWMQSLLIMLIAFSAKAADPPALRLTLTDAVQMALRQNPQVQVANLNIAQSQENQTIARAGLLPQVNFGVSERVERANLQSLFGSAVPGFPGHIGPFWVVQAGPSGSIPIFDLTLWRRWQASRESVRGSQADQLTIREQNVLLVVSQYQGSLRAAADVKAAQSRVDLAKALFDQASDLQKNGVGTGIDTLRSNVQFQNERQRLIDSQVELKTSLYGLARLLNIDPHQNIELADESEFFHVEAYTADQSIERAFTERPEAKAVNSQIRVTEFQKKEAAAASLPKLTLSGQWTQQGLSPSTTIPVYDFAANVDFPLFTGGRIKAQTAVQDIELKKLAQQQTELRNRIALEVKTAVAQLDAAKSEVEVANQGVDLAREEVVEARDRFQAGVANNIEVITAQDELARANDNQIAALYRYNQARADLAHATGQMESLYAK